MPAQEPDFIPVRFASFPLLAFVCPKKKKFVFNTREVQYARLDNRLWSIVNWLTSDEMFLKQGTSNGREVSVTE